MHSLPPSLTLYYFNVGVSNVSVQVRSTILQHSPLPSHPMARKPFPCIQGSLDQLGTWDVQFLWNLLFGTLSACVPKSIFVDRQILPGPSPSMLSTLATGTSTLLGSTAMSSPAPMRSVFLVSHVNRSSLPPKCPRETWGTTLQRSVSMPV